MEDLVSAIITTHNRVDYLKKAIESVLKQTYNNIELIVVDDCSNDLTKEYCSSIENLKYIYIPKEEHKNGNYARNLGIKNSLGKYVAFLDDDDEWFPTKIEKQVKKMKENKKYGVIYVGRKVEVNDGEYYYNLTIKPNFIGDLSKKIFINNISTTSAFLFKKSIIEEVGLFDEKVNFWQETELMMRICQRCEVGAVDESLVLYRTNFNDKRRLTNNIDGFLKNMQYINQKFSKEIEQLSIEMKKAREAMIYNDVADRYATMHKSLNARKYLIKVFLTQPNLKNLIKAILNYTSYKKTKLTICWKKIIEKYKNICRSEK